MFTSTFVHTIVWNFQNTPLTVRVKSLSIKSWRDGPNSSQPWVVTYIPATKTLTRLRIDHSFVYIVTVSLYLILSLLTNVYTHKLLYILYNYVLNIYFYEFLRTKCHNITRIITNTHYLLYTAHTLLTVFVTTTPKSKWM